MPTEQEKAVQYRADQLAGQKARLAREKALAGSASAKTDLETAWAPLKRWEGWEAPELVPGDAE